MGQVSVWFHQSLFFMSTRTSTEQSNACTSERNCLPAIIAVCYRTKVRRQRQTGHVIILWVAVVVTATDADQSRALRTRSPAALRDRTRLDLVLKRTGRHFKGVPLGTDAIKRQGGIFLFLEKVAQRSVQCEKPTRRATWRVILGAILFRQLFDCSI